MLDLLAQFDSPLRSVAWATMSDGARIAAVIGCVLIPAIVLGALAAGERKERRLALALFGVLALLWGSYARLAGVIKYVSPDGSALWAACDTTATPCSIATAQANAAGGDVVMLMDGTYSVGINTGVAGTAGNTVTWRAVTPLGAVLNGYASGQTDRVILADSAYHTFDGIDVRVQEGAGSTTYGLYVSAANVEFKDGRISYDKDPALVSSVNVHGAHLRALTTLTDTTIEHVTYGVYLFGPTAGHASQVLRVDVRNMDVGIEENSDCFGLSGNASYSFAGALISDSDCAGYRDDGFDAFTQDDMTIADTRFHGPMRNVKGNTSCLKMGYEASSGTRAMRISCLGLGVNANDFGAVLTGVSNAVMESVVMAGGSTGIEVAQRNAAGGADNVLRHISMAGFTVHGLRVSTGATGTVVQNSVLDGATGDVNVGSGLTVTGTNNAHAHGLVTGAGTYTQTGSVNADPQFVGGANPTTAEGFAPRAGSPLCNAGTPLRLGLDDYFGQNFPLVPAIGAVRCPDPRVSLAAANRVALTAANRVGLTSGNRVDLSDSNRLRLD